MSETAKDTRLMSHDARRTPRYPIEKRLVFGVSFASLATVLVWSAARAKWTSVSFGFSWLALNLFLVALAYFRQDPRVFGKNQDGNSRQFQALVMFPFLFVTWSVWRLQNALSSEPTWNEVTPRLFVGRKCALKRLPPNTSLVIDLTAEFPTAKDIRKAFNLVCIPTLDGCAPSLDDCSRAFGLIRSTGDSVVYVHCANGHGRSVAFAAALLGEQGIAKTPDEAIEMLKRCRPKASLNSSQRRFLDQAFKGAPAGAKARPPNG